MGLDLFLSSLLSLVIRKAADSLIERVCEMWGMEDNRKRLCRLLLAIQNKISDAEERGVDNAALQEWMKELHAAAYEAVDVLDEFQYKAFRQEAKRQLPSYSARVVKGFSSSEGPILFRPKISYKLTQVLGKIDVIVAEMSKFNIVPRDPVHTIDRETYSFVIESEVFGRDGEIEEIVQTLLDPQRESDNVSVLPIVGMGGLGKTTLAQLVYNHERIKGHFHLLMWVCVSTEFSFVNIVKSVIQVARQGGDTSTSNKEVLQKQLREILDKKKYLLVLDDVWNEKRGKWDELKTVLFSGASAGSVVIVTTRSKKVASIMGTLPDIDLTSLADNDSWKLFEKRAFGARFKEPSEEIIKIGRTIVRNCAGLPLAVNAMGGLMGTMFDVRDWRVVAEHKIWDVLASSENTLPILKLSYDHLPSHTKQCFSFCAIFPQGYLIELDTLNQLWIANDFIPNDRTIDLEDKGRYIFHELCSRSFFTDIQEKETDYGSVITCKIHDIMHDLATQISQKKCSTLLEMNAPKMIQNEVQHLLMLGDIFNPPEDISSILKQFPLIRTCLVDGNYVYNITKDKHLLKLSSLRALKFHLEFSPPKELGHMRHLKYLDLSESNSFNILPEIISTLYNLLTLKLSNSDIHELPEGMRHLINLRHLFLDGCIYLECMPIGLGQLKCLRTLTNYIVNPERGGTIEELKNLNLCGHLSLSGLEKVRDGGDAQTMNLAAKSNLYSLKLEWARRKMMRNDHEVLEALKPHNELKFLRIEGYGGHDFPKWIKEPLITKNLKKLWLQECIKCVELPPMWQFPSLEKLYLMKMVSLRYIFGRRCMHVDGEPLITLSSLRVLEMHKLDSLEGWHERDTETVTFPNLNELVIYDCPKLKGIPMQAPSIAKLIVRGHHKIKLCQISNLSVLSNLNIEDSTNHTETHAFRPPKTLAVMEIEGFENVNPLEEEEESKQNFQANSLCKLRIKNSNWFFSCRRSKLASGFFSYRRNEQALGFWNHFAALEILAIQHCNDLVYWPEEEFRNLRCLKSLTISKCKNFTGSLLVSSSSAPCLEDSLPQLESLEIHECHELVQVPAFSKSLKVLYISFSPNLSHEGLATLSNLTELKELNLLGCTNLKAWPDNMGHLPSLEHLIISDSPKLESFPEDLQRRLSSLQSLGIIACPALERHCIEGDYMDLVSSIPRTEFSIQRDQEEEGEDKQEISVKSESNLRRFLPILRRF